MSQFTLSTAAANAVLNALNDLVNAGSGPGTIKLYTGTKPAGPATAITTQTLLGTLTLADPAGTVASGAWTFGAITSDSAADAGGTATWARISDSDGVGVIDIDVSTVGGTGFGQMNTTAIVKDGPITAPSVVVTA